MHVELKICERCGALWLRPIHSGWIYCAGCLPFIRNLARRVALRQAKKAGAR
jgi:hypothetical protein